MINSESTESREPSGQSPAGRGRFSVGRWFAVAAVVVIILILVKDRLDSRSRPSGSPVEWSNDYTAALTAAKEQSKPVLLAFHADWCPPCNQMKSTTYHDSEVISTVAKFIPVMIDVDRQKELTDRFGVEGYPTYIVTDQSGGVIETFAGYYTSSEFIQTLNAALAKVRTFAAGTP